jgi:hypothetical protein
MDPETPENTSILLKIIVDLKNELYQIKAKILAVKEKRKHAYEQRKQQKIDKTMTVRLVEEIDSFDFSEIYASLEDC